jgi:hypothetical protein
VAVDIDQFVRELRAFDDRRAVVKAMRRKINKPVPALRKAIKAHAIAILPHTGGLGAWAARASISSTIRYASSRSAGVRLKGSRKSQGDKSDLKRLDAGTVRAPSWGHRTAASWHTQSVAPGWFTDPASDNEQWRDVVDQAVDEAFDEIRRG